MSPENQSSPYPCSSLAACAYCSRAASSRAKSSGVMPGARSGLNSSMRAAILSSSAILPSSAAAPPGISSSMVQRLCVFSVIDNDPPARVRGTFYRRAARM